MGLFQQVRRVPDLADRPGPCGSGFFLITNSARNESRIVSYRKHVPMGIQSILRLLSFAPVLPARCPMFGAAARAEREFAGRPVLSEDELYGGPAA